MKRAAGLVFAAVLFGCGTGTTTQGLAGKEPATLPTDGTPTGRVGFNHALTQGLTNAKVVLKTSSSTDVLAQTYDSATDSFVNVPCTPSGNECAAAQGSHCGAGGLCVVTTTNTAIFYVWNSSNPPATGFTFPVPCDGRTYAAEVYAAILAGSALQIQDMYQAPSIVVNTDCTVSTQPTWTPVSKPSLNIPTIYANLPAPNDTYTIGVNGVAYPFSSSYTMTSAQGTGTAVAAKAYSVGGAVFTAPTTTDPITFTATFGLNSSILFSSEASTPWQLQVTGSATPTGSTQVSGP